MGIFISILFIIAQMSIDRWMDKPNVIYPYNGILFSQKKEWNTYSYYNMDGLEVLTLCDRRQTQWSHLYEGLPWWLSDKESACNAGAAGDLGSIPGLGRSPGEGNDNPLQYSCLENSMDRGAWWAIVHRVSKSQTQLSNFHLLTHSWMELLCPRSHLLPGDLWPKLKWR